MRNDLVISGLGITAAIGQGRVAFTSALLSGSHAFGVMKRPGRQASTEFLGAEIQSLRIPESLSKRLLRTASFSGQVALATLHEAWNDAKLAAADPERIGLVIGGSNFQQRELVNAQAAYADQIQYLKPTYGMSFMDTDLCGLCTEQFDIRGFAHTIGGASASGQLAVTHAIQAVRSGDVDICIAMGALMDISYWECQALRSLGAMGSDRYATDPDNACRPFDQDRDGFIFGECCGVVVVERLASSIQRNASVYAKIAGWGTVMDGHRNPDPSYDGEVRVIKLAMERANFQPADIDYVNPHGSGSILGDATEIRALEACGLAHARINSTKSIVGHGLTAAGAIGVIATLVQMQTATLHPSRNLERPLGNDRRWVAKEPVSHAIRNSLNLSLGFGGINSALCLSSIASE